jgi:hypothetical protein
MDDREALASVADDLAAWQVAAQRLPLAELSAMVATWQNELAESLNAFNEVYLDDECGETADVIASALGQVTRRATAMAIFTLGISQRLGPHLAAQQN